MKKNVLSGLLSMAIVCGIGAYSIASAAEAAAPKADKPAKTEKAAAAKDETVKGTVTITKDDKGAMKECCLKSADGTMYVCSPAAQWKAMTARLSNAPAPLARRTARSACISSRSTHTRPRK